mmetsp:Transcript_87522/g.220225  ORF Transcript_87522/g.220225 Transcript_87522/m.220225 type:complete len:283 (+) Transcript_87522:357-1205(+)
MDDDATADEGGNEWSDSEEEALSALKAVVASETAVATGVADGVVDWRRGLQELRRQRDAAAAAAGAPAASSGLGPGVAGATFAERRLDPDQLLQLLRDAIRQREWRAVTTAVARNADMAATARRLEISEAVKVLKAMALRHEAEPKERSRCSHWILQILESCGEPLLAHKGARQALRPLLAALENRLSTSGSSGEALACLGKWRYVAELAAVRRATLKVAREGGSAEAASEAPAAQQQQEEAPVAKAAKEGDLAEEESSDQDDDDVDAEEGAGADDDAESDS